MNCAGCAPAGYTYPPAAPRRHHWIEFRANGSPEPPRVPSPPAPRSCGYYCPRESMLADCVKPVCPEKTFNSGQCYTPSDYAWMDVPNPYLQPNTGLYQAPRNTTYQRDYFGPDKGNADYLPALDEWMRKASTEEREAAVAIMKQRGGGYGGGHGGDNNQRCGLDRTAIRCPTRPLGATRSRLPGALRFPHQPTAGVVTGLPEWAAANPIVKLQQQRLLEAVQNPGEWNCGPPPRYQRTTGRKTGQKQETDTSNVFFAPMSQPYRGYFIIHPEWASEQRLMNDAIKTVQPPFC
ncbi:hypothetical protein NP493_197g01000 [Ridgeia piscesae]|uniref:Uncharacterized protein n=1 Tax=Ridgeia piscesae TaxID=27915 RepID=A0AAD9UEI8_RIDPI|nr:hypothetical protein NP493_197g01000 [Ridgeia piscesae]